MDRKDIMNNVQQIFRDIFDDETLMINEETNANDIDDWDSFEQINLLVSIEGCFNIKFDITEVSDLKNVASMIDLIERKIG